METGMGANFSMKHLSAALYLRNHHEATLSRVNWTSDPTPWTEPTLVHNCVGFALDQCRWIEPPSIPGYDEGNPRHHWPFDVDPKTTIEERFHIDHYIKVAALVDFAPCGQDISWEKSVEKIVFIHKNEQFSHAALQVSANVWKSKLGLFSDFEHPFDGLFGDNHGAGFVILKRSRRTRNLG